MAEIGSNVNTEIMPAEVVKTEVNRLNQQDGHDVVVIQAGAADCLPKNGIVIIIPAYNEERFIGSVVLKARKHAGTVIVVDDGSSDATAEVAASAGVIVAKHLKNHGKGAALKTGFELARKLNPDAVVILDADGQHMPEELAQVVDPVLNGQADIVVGSRYLIPTSEVPRHRIWGHWIFNQLTRAASGVNTTDSQSGFRAFSPTALEKITFLSDGFSVESEMQFLAHELGLRLLEVPINIRYLDKPKRPVLSHGMQVLNGMLWLVGQYRPLLYFGLPGFVILLCGLVGGIVVVDIYSRSRVLAVGYAMLSVLLTIIGMLLFSTGIILHSIRALLMEFMKPRK